MPVTFWQCFRSSIGHWTEWGKYPLKRRKTRYTISRSVIGHLHRANRLKLSSFFNRFTGPPVCNWCVSVTCRSRTDHELRSNFLIISGGRPWKGSDDLKNFFPQFPRRTGNYSGNRLSSRMIMILWGVLHGPVSLIFPYRPPIRLHSPEETHR
jgi:hypothetical protein